MTSEVRQSFSGNLVYILNTDKDMTGRGPIEELNTVLVRIS